MRVCCPNCDEAVGSDAEAGRAACPTCGVPLSADAERSERATWRPLPTGTTSRLLWRERDVAGGQRLEIGSALVIGSLRALSTIGIALGIGVATLTSGSLFNHFVHIDRDAACIGTGTLPASSQRLPASQILTFEAAQSQDWRTEDFLWEGYRTRSFVKANMRHGRAEALDLPMTSFEMAGLVAARLNAMLAEVRRASAYRG